jgi:hypothetical protein
VQCDDIRRRWFIQPLDLREDPAYALDSSNWVFIDLGDDE